MTTTKTYDVIVVGGGLAGLAAGATAAQAGLRTVVLEGHALGGRARCVERDGYTFNMGAHALYVGSTGMPVLAALGVQPTGGKPPLEQYRALRDGELFLLPAGPGSLLRTKLLSARGKAQFSKLLLSVPRLDARSFAGVSVADWLRSFDLRPDVHGAMEALVRIGTYSADFESLSADVAITQLTAASKAGVLYLDGGWDQLTHALSALVEVRTGVLVTSVASVGSGVEVQTADGPVTAGAVVVAVGTPAAARSILAGEPEWDDVGEPLTAACLDLGVRRVPTPGYVLGFDEPVYGTTQSPPARQAPDGGAVVSVIRYGARTAELDRPQLEGWLPWMGVRPEDVVVDRFLARMVVAGAVPSPHRGGMAGRPRVGSTGMDNVFLAGDWVGPDGNLADAALASGQAAAVAAVRAVERSSTMVA